MTPDEYLAWMTPPAQNVCPRYNLPWAVCVAQGAIESQWGIYAIGNYNIFGRKWGGWGNYIEKETQECYSGVWQTITAKFQDYNSLDEAIQDWCVLMTQEPVYVNATVGITDPIQFAYAIGPIYATDPQYGDKIVQTMRACGMI